MEVTIDNIKDIKYFPDKSGPDWDINSGYKQLTSILIDLAELNSLLICKGESNKQLYIDYQDYHNEYSPERTDPCPDYYGFFSLRFINNPSECVGDYMVLDEIENALFILINFVEF